MSLTDLDAAKLKLILKTSQGFPTQYESSKAIVKLGELSPSRTGHPLSRHLRGAAGFQFMKNAWFTTKFSSLDQMANTLSIVLKTPQGQAVLQRLQPGLRETIQAEIDPLFDIAAAVDFIGNVVFGRHDLVMAGIHRVKCKVVIEGRKRAGELYLHIHTFYPAVDAIQMNKLLST